MARRDQLLEIFAAASVEVETWPKWMKSQEMRRFPRRFKGDGKVTKDQVREQLFKLIEEEVAVLRSIQVESDKPLGHEAEEFVSWLAGMFDTYRVLTINDLEPMDSRADCDILVRSKGCCHSKGESE